MCELKVCLNGATCTTTPVSKIAECVCKKGYYGESCGRKNFCKKSNKISCYNNGTCLINGIDNKPYCECSAGNAGTNCELQTASNKQITNLSSGKLNFQNNSFQIDFRTSFIEY